MCRSSIVFRIIIVVLFHIVFVSSESSEYTSQQVIDSEWLEVFTAEELAAFFSQQPEAALQNNAVAIAATGSQEEVTGTDYIYEHVIDRVDSSDKCNPPSDALPVIVAVTNREALVGCHSFRQHLNPKWRTVFVLNRRVAKNFGIDEMVKNAGCDDTLGATLLMLSAARSSADVWHWTTRRRSCCPGQRSNFSIRTIVMYTPFLERTSTTRAWTQ